MKKVLVIEDEGSMLNAVVDMLRISGYECLGARNGVEGITLAKSFLPDLVVSDVMMPHLDGYGVLLALQEEPQTAIIPFIFLTAQTATQDLRRGMALGADDYLFKPFEPQELLAAVALRLDKHDRLNQAATERNEELKAFINTTLPHELRTPLTGLIGYLDMLQTDFCSFEAAAVEKMVKHMSTSANRLYRLVENYLMFAQLTLTLQDQAVIGQLRQFATYTQPARSIPWAAKKQAAAHGRSPDLVIHTVANAPLQIFRENLDKIVCELVDNALKFSEKGTPVTLESTFGDGMYRLSISDSGRGMSAEQIGAIEANRQFNRARYEQQGVGLGLIISKLICNIFEADLHIAPNAQGGITTTVSFPVRTEYEEKHVVNPAPG